MRGYPNPGVAAVGRKWALPMIMERMFRKNMTIPVLAQWVWPIRKWKGGEKLDWQTKEKCPGMLAGGIAMVYLCCVRCFDFESLVSMVLDH